jgi:radical SAM/Cys-rich protein
MEKAMRESSNAEELEESRPPRLDVADQLQMLAKPGIPTFDAQLLQSGLAPIRADPTSIFQVNVGKLCNQSCHHCHVDAGPTKTEENMDWPTFEACLGVIAEIKPRTVDITGGAPELNPHFRRFVRALRALGVPEIIDRCNLSVLLLDSQKDLADFLAEQRVHIVASLPAVNAAQTDAQRGQGVFDKSILALKKLNALGYGMEGSGLVLTLMSNPAGAFLPPPQSSAEARFKSLLKRNFQVSFTQLIELTNMPIHRFLEYLIASGNFESYMAKLSDAFNPAAVDGLMCKNTLSVGWDGRLFDCDFNQQLELEVAPASSRSVFEYQKDLMDGRSVRVANHCLGCTAGQGSSCGGATA